jgi:hypothetical protein
MSQNKNNSGVLFRNSKKKFIPTDDGKKVPADDKEAKKPDYTGDATIDGVDYWMAAWVKESQKQNGAKYFSFAFTPKSVEVEP